ncbi:MAG: c-type cytochrome, partial [Candidatus Limnocylindria bacterium]
AGRALYGQHCAVCHGAGGRGDGLAAAGLEPPPADLVLHVPQHSDGELFHFVTRGIRGTAMPAWGRTLSERERWVLVIYLRELARVPSGAADRGR